MPTFENVGLASAPGFDSVRFLGVPPSAGTCQRSLFVDQAVSRNGSAVKIRDFPSGAHA